MVKWAQKLYNSSVFRRTPENFTMSDSFAILFHRLTAATYFMHSVWAVIVIIDGAPSLINQQGQQWTTIFAIFVLALTLPACIGSTFFPQHARTELFAGVSFVALMLVYYYFMVIDTIAQGTPASNMILPLSVVILPICRTSVIVRSLIKQADVRKAITDENELPGVRY